MPSKPHRVNFLYTGSGDLQGLSATLERADIEGAQVVYSWRQPEPAEGEYNFSAIERDLATTEADGRKLFVQLQDRFFSDEARNIPDYLLTEDIYGGGLVAQLDNPGEGVPVGYGGVAMQWNPALRARYQVLLKTLADRFDGRIFGINLPEAAIDIDMEAEAKASAFSCDAYFDAELEKPDCSAGSFQRNACQFLAMRME